MNKNNYICPICGFDKLKEPPYNQQNAPSYEICPCCGFEFGFDRDATEDTSTAFRQRWIENGAHWFILKLKPKNWDLQKQLNNIYRKK